MDLDVQFGDLATALSLSPEHTLAQLSRATVIDATTVKLFLTLYYNGLYILAGANDPVDADSIGHRHVAEVLPLLAQNFDFVIVDTPAGLDERTLGTPSTVIKQLGQRPAAHSSPRRRISRSARAQYRRAGGQDVQARRVRR